MPDKRKIKSLLSKVQDKRSLLEYLQNFMMEERAIRFDEILEYRTRHFTMIVEDVYQDRNASAILRSCDCFGIQDVSIIERENKYKIAREIAKGSEKWVNATIYDGYENNTRKCMSDLREKGYRIVGASPHMTENTLDKFDISRKAAIFMGGEKDGLSEDVMSKADEFLYIPIVGFTESFNISVAAAIILYEITAKLRNSEIDWRLRDEEKLEIKLNWTIETIASSEYLIRKYLESRNITR